MIRLSARIPEGLPERVTAPAAADRQALNSEILRLLEIALAAPWADAGSAVRRADVPPQRGKPESSPG
jgi:hypothetical protein